MQRAHPVHDVNAEAWAVAVSSGEWVPAGPESFPTLQGATRLRPLATGHAPKDPAVHIKLSVRARAAPG
jgi:hypothetical protein